MLVEDGRRLLISNLDVLFMTENLGSFLLDDPAARAAAEAAPRQAQRSAHKRKHEGMPRDRYSTSAIEFFQLFPDARGRFQLSTAVRMSASFPYISPAVNLPTDPPRRVVDAGYFDNYGVSVAAAWVYHYRHWLKANTSGIVLIQLRDARDEKRRRELYVQEDEGQGWLSRGVGYSLQWLTSPPTGAGAALESMMSYHNDELVQGLSELLNADDEEFFTTVVFECPEQIALNWYLTPGEQERIKHGLEEKTDAGRQNVASLERMKRWWNTRPNRP
jgi:hypothetical protein